MEGHWERRLAEARRLVFAGCVRRDGRDVFVVSVDGEAYRVQFHREPKCTCDYYRRHFWRVIGPQGPGVVTCDHHLAVRLYLEEEIS